nr:MULTISPECIES: YigZ family protein [unclassified Granulicatella]
MQEYKQIARDGSAEITIKGSRFICHLKRVNDEQDALQFIQHIKKEHRKATHNCSAYLIGETDLIQRAHDDGEPSGTAGVPMLEVLKKQELHYIAAVVTRYFGGTKLGAGGLIRAYSSSVSFALNQLGIIRHTKQAIVHITLEYAQVGKFDYFLTQHTYELIHTHYTQHATYVCGVLSQELEQFIQTVQNLFNGKVQIEQVDEKYVDLPLSHEPLNISDDLFND